MSGHAGMVPWETHPLAYEGYHATSGLRLSTSVEYGRTWWGFKVPYFTETLQQAWTNDEGDVLWVDVPKIDDKGELV